MGTLYVFVIIVTLSTHCSADVVSHSETDRSIASVILKEGQSAEILCMTKETGDFFWWKGETLYNSTLVASFTAGEVIDDSQPYSVTANGTLHIRSVTLKDEGNYFCRVSSTENECYGEVKILVQASLRNFDLAIDRCDRESSCLLYLDPSQFTSLTCTALNAPPLMTLKWFNGSKEIANGIEHNEVLLPNGNSRELTSTVTAVYGHPASLTCQAVDPKRSNDDVRFAHAQVEMKVPFIETLPSWIIISVTSAVCFIVFGIFLLIKAMVNREQRKKYKKLKKEDDESLTKEVKTKEKEINAKHQELTEFKVSAESKASELNELKAKLKQTEEELNKSRKENIELQTKTAKAEAKITYAEKSAKTKDQEIADLKGEVQIRAKAIAELEKKIAHNEAKITATEESAKNKDQEIANKDKELTDLKSKLLNQTQGMSTLKGDLKSKEKSIADLEVKLKQQEEEINKERNANIKLQITTAIAEGETTVVKETEERRNKEISELKSKLKEKDSELVEINKELTNVKEDLEKKEHAKEQKSS